MSSATRSRNFRGLGAMYSLCPQGWGSAAPVHLPHHQKATWGQWSPTLNVMAAYASCPRKATPTLSTIRLLAFCFFRLIQNRDLLNKQAHYLLRVWVTSAKILEMTFQYGTIGLSLLQQLLSSNRQSNSDQGRTLLFFYGQCNGSKTGTPALFCTPLSDNLGSR